MRLKAKGERVQFDGKNLALSTVKSYASKKDHPLNSKAVSFIKRHNQETWTDKIEKNQEHLPTWGPLLATPIQAAFGKAPKAIGKMMLDGTRDPRDSFSEGFKQAADVDVKKIKKSLGKVVDAFFKVDIKTGESDKISEAITKGRQSALGAIAEATKDLAIGAKEVTEGLLWGTFNAGISGVGKVIGGSAFLIGNAVDMSIRVADKVKFEDALTQFYGNIGKDELVGVSQFIDEEGVFDAEGYSKEMEKAVAEIKKQVQKYIQSVNEKHKNKKASNLKYAREILDHIQSELEVLKNSK